MYKSLNIKNPAEILLPRDTYKYTDILSPTPSKATMQDTKTTTQDATVTEDVQSDKAEIARRVQQCKRFMENFQKHPSVEMLDRPGFVVTAPAPAHTYLRSPEAVRRLLTKGRYLRATTAPKGKVWEWLQNRYVLGERQKASDIRGWCHITHNNQQVGCTGRSSHTLTVLWWSRCTRTSFRVTAQATMGSGK